MCKKSFIILMAVLVGFVIPSLNNSAGAYSTTVRYSSPGSSYYELVVPMVMAPGETATVSATGTWDSQTILKVTADGTVTLQSDVSTDEIVLNVLFGGINKFGNDSTETNVSTEISVEEIDDSVTGTWEGTFVYYVDLFSGTINEIEHSGIIPEGGTYYVSATDSMGSILEGEYWQATAVYEAGEKFPDEINVGDTYVYGDYEYRYQCGYESGWYNNYTYSNWGVRVVDSTKTSFGNMLSYINGKPVDTLRGTFQECEFLVTSPQLSTEAKNMANAFNYCINLVEPPVIPNKVTTINYAFYYCEKLASAPVIPESVKDIGMAFYGCFSMSGTIEINSAELTYYAGALHNTQITAITGSISDDLKTQLLATIE